MVRWMPSLAAAGILGCTAVPVCALEPVLRAVPSAITTSLAPGVSRLNAMAFAYRPGTVSGPSPLIVLFHPAGGNSQDFLRAFKRAADQRGALPLALRSTAQTWTLKADGKGGADFGPEPGALDQALTSLFAKAVIDPQRVVALGFSDGASYALSIGLANPRLFRGVVAL